MNGRILAVDYGQSRIGLALSDQMQVLASPLETLASKKDVAKDAESLATLIKDRQVIKVLIGLPLHLDGNDSPMSLLVKSLKENLEQLVSCPIELVDERLSSKVADSLLKEQGLSRKKRAKKIDNSSACLLLQNHLDMFSF